MCVCVCVCVREQEKEIDRESGCVFCKRRIKRESEIFDKSCSSLTPVLCQRHIEKSERNSFRNRHFKHTVKYTHMKRETHTHLKLKCTERKKLLLREAQLVLS